MSMIMIKKEITVPLVLAILPGSRIKWQRGYLIIKIGPWMPFFWREKANKQRTDRWTRKRCIGEQYIERDPLLVIKSKHSCERTRIKEKEYSHWQYSKNHVEKDLTAWYACNFSCLQFFFGSFLISSKDILVWLAYSNENLNEDSVEDTKKKKFLRLFFMSISFSCLLADPRELGEGLVWWHWCF